MGAMDKLRDKLQAGKGRTKKTTGRVTGDRSMEAEGKVDEVSGNLKQAGEKVKDAFEK